jgi:hypothetical protein
MRNPLRQVVPPVRNMDDALRAVDLAVSDFVPGAARLEASPLRIEPENDWPRAEQSHPLPSYVEHQADVNEVGKLSAQAMAAEYEKSAQALEAMSRTLVEMGGRCDEDTMRAIRENERVKSQIAQAVEACEASAARYRNQAKAVFEQIERASLLADEVRRTCADLSMRVQSFEPKARPAPTENTSDLVAMAGESEGT